ncbi:MAG: hypothetical protein WCC84_15755 [Candidatus Cybelea sp.]
MDFLERYFHVSPDSGSGTVEFGYLIAAALLVFTVLHRSAPLRRAWWSRIQAFFSIKI